MNLKMITSKFTVILLISAVFLININAIGAIQTSNELNEQMSKVDSSNDNVDKDSSDDTTPNFEHHSGKTQPDSSEKRDTVSILAGITSRQLCQH